jgi:glutamate/tyrosine decarboxylase-like PLP-dependent enzyme
MLFDEILRAATQLESEIAAGPIVPAVTPQEIRNHLTSRYDFREPAALDEIGADVERMLRTWQVQVTHPRYLGLFNPSVTPASVVADALVAMYNPQLATWRTSPAANEIERHTLLWLAAKFGFPANAAANFTVGGAEANLSAVIVALSRAFPECGEDGVRSLSARPTLYLTGEAHHVFNRVAQITGLGRSAVRIVAVGSDLIMVVEFV